MPLQYIQRNSDRAASAIATNGCKPPVRACYSLRSRIQSSCARASVSDSARGKWMYIYCLLELNGRSGCVRDVHRDVRCAGMRERQRDVCERGALEVRWHVCDDHVREMHRTERERDS